MPCSQRSGGKALLLTRGCRTPVGGQPRAQRPTSQQLGCSPLLSEGLALGARERVSTIRLPPGMSPGYPECFQVEVVCQPAGHLLAQRGAGGSEGMGERRRRFSQLQGWEGQRGCGSARETPAASPLACQAIGNAVIFFSLIFSHKVSAGSPKGAQICGSRRLVRMPSSRHRAPFCALRSAAAGAECPRKAESCSRQTSCRLREPAALQRETPGSNWVCQLRTFTHWVGKFPGPTALPSFSDFLHSPRVGA